MRIAPLAVDFSADGRHALVALPYRRATLIDLATGRTRRLPRGLEDAALSPDGGQVAAVRRRGDRCDLAVLTSGRTRSLRPIPCLSVISYLVRPLPQLERIGAGDELVFTPDDQAVVIQESGGALAGIALADGARQPLPIITDGRFDAL